MKARLRNVTLTLQETLLRWARMEAARQETSVSGFVTSVLEQHRNQKDDYQSAMRRALARKPFLMSEGPHLTREEAHDRSRLR